VDIVTHALASLALARGFFPRARGLVILFAVLAGMAADLDWFSNFFGPSNFLAWHSTYLHSIFAVFLFLTAIPGVPVARSHWGKRQELTPRHGNADGIPHNPQAVSDKADQRFWAGAFAAPACAAVLHVLMDACQSGGVMLFWPFSTKRFAADWLPSLDPWILVILIAAIAVPELLRLVSSEIGAKSNKPRGRTGALIGLALVVVYVGVRGTLHSNVAALLESRSFHGETARRVAIYPEALSLATWHGVVETESALNEIDVNAFATANFDADTSLRFYKPEASASLNAARNTRTAQRFLAVSQIPKASVEKTDVGYVVILRDLRYAAAGETSHEIAALIELDPDSKVTSEELVWARDLAVEHTQLVSPLNPSKPFLRGGSLVYSERNGGAPLFRRSRPDHRFIVAARATAGVAKRCGRRCNWQPPEWPRESTPTTNAV
jgi:membrane-bound metal-dependent hydrolase YbcI (DUF457 family)